MTITIAITPEVKAALARQAAAEGREVESYAASLLEQAVHPAAAPPTAPAKDMTKALDALPGPKAAATPPERRTGQALIDGFAEIRGLLSDEEIDRMFRRNPSAARPVDLA